MNLFKQFRYAIPLILFLSVIILLWRGLSLHPSEIPSPLINKPTPTFSLPTLFGPKKITTQNDLRGHVTLVNVWATWCPACAEEHSYLVELARQQHIIFYGLDYKDDPNAAKKWLKTQGNPYRIVAIDQYGNTAIDWGVYGAPETFVVDKMGVIRYKKIGPITEDVWKNELKPIVDQLNNN